MGIAHRKQMGCRPEVTKTACKCPPTPQTKQYNQTGPKYTGPNYKQKDPSIAYDPDMKM